MSIKVRQWNSYPNMKEYILDQVLATESGCWEWPTGHRSGGYGEVTIKGKKRRVHRVSYETFVGPVPAGKSVCHHCDNPKCVNPEHLYAGTALDNARDVIERGSPGNSKLRKADIERAKSLYRDGMREQDLALTLGVSLSTVKNIIRNKTWLGIGPDVWRAPEKPSPVTQEQLQEVKKLLGKVPVKEIVELTGVKLWMVYEIRIKEVEAGTVAKSYTPRNKSIRLRGCELRDGEWWKQCRRCGKIKRVEADYYKLKAGRVHSWCKTCCIKVVMEDYRNGRGKRFLGAAAGKESKRRGW